MCSIPHGFSAASWRSDGTKPISILPPTSPPSPHPPTPAISCATCASLCARRDLICYRNAVSIIVVIVPTLPVVSPSGVLLYFNDPSSRSFLPANVKYFFFFFQESIRPRILGCGFLSARVSMASRLSKRECATVPRVIDDAMGVSSED